MALNRLVALRTEPPGLIEEAETLNSERPAYFMEVRLLLTRFDAEFRTDREAEEAVRGGGLGGRVQGLCRPITAFPATLVVSTGNRTVADTWRGCRGRTKPPWPGGRALGYREGPDQPQSDSDPVPDVRNVHGRTT